MTSFQQYRDHHDAQGPVVLETVPAAGRRYQGDRAGFVIRAIAAVLDVVFVGIIVVLLWIGLWLFLLIFNPLIDPDLTVEVTPPSGYFLLAGYLLMWLYWTWMWATNGRSLGQYLMGLRVVGRQGRRFGWKLAMLRSGFSAVFPPGLVWAIISPRNRSVQDVMLRTSVIHDWSSSSSESTPESTPESSPESSPTSTSAPTTSPPDAGE